MRPFLLLLLLLSAARAGDEILVEREDDAVIVRSPITQGNFLFRAPGAFTRADPPEGFDLLLENGAERITMRLTTPGAADPGAFFAAHREEYGGGAAEPAGRGRWSFQARSDAGHRTIFVVLDGDRAYELFLDSAEPEALDAVARGFTLLDPKGPPVSTAAPTPEALAAREIGKRFYRLRLLKPDHFTLQPVDPNEDPGIVYHLERVDEDKNRCDVRIRVFLAKTVSESLEERAARVMEQFAKRYPPAKIPKRPSRDRVRGAREACKLKMAGKVEGGTVITQHWRFVDHENGRIYEIEMTLWGAAERAFKKEIAAFWKKLEITDG